VTSIEQLVQRYRTQYEVGTSKLVGSDAKLAKRLGCTEGGEWMRIEGLRYAPGQNAPICWTEVYIHPDYMSTCRFRYWMTLRRTRMADRFQRGAVGSTVACPNKSP
jgi:hypothetical protein